MSEYTLTTMEMRQIVGDALCEDPDGARHKTEVGCLGDAIFDRWLAEVKRAAAEKAWDACRQELFDIRDDELLDEDLARANPYRKPEEEE